MNQPVTQPANQQRPPNQGRPPNDQEVIVIPLSQHLGPLQTIVVTKGCWDDLSASLSANGVDSEKTYVLVGPSMPNGRVERSFLRGIVGFYTNYPTGIIPANM